MICTNEDSFIPIAGRKYPGTGSILESVQITLNNEKGSQLTTRPDVVGMPNPFAVEQIIKDH